MKNGLQNQYFKEEKYILNWKIEDKYIPIVVIRHDIDDKNDLINAIYTKKYQTFIINQNDEYFKVPSFGYIETEVLKDLYYYDYGVLYEQIDKSDINEYTFDILNEFALKLIQVYDENKDQKLLHLAAYLLNKLEEFECNKPYIIINQLQIKKRLGTFSNTDTKILQDMNVEELPFLCVINILLDNKEKANYYFKQMSGEDQALFLNYPIYHLYQELERKSLFIDS